MSQRDTLQTGSVVDRYEVVGRISAGGMGEVYRARDPLLERELVLKVLPQRAQFNSDALERFVREARAASALNHPNIVTIYAIGEADNFHFIAMELVKGRTLRQLGKDHASVKVVAEVGSQAARALAVAHEVVRPEQHPADELRRLQADDTDDDGGNEDRQRAEPES